MKFIFSTILIAFYIGLANSECSSDEWKVVPNLDFTRILGRWYTYKTYEEGHTDCIWHQVDKHPTKNDTTVWSINILFRNGTNINGISTAAEVTLSDPSTAEGKLNIALENGGFAEKHVIFIDYNEIAFTRSCVNSVEFFGIYLRNLYPSEATVEKSNQIIEEYGLDTSRISTA